MAGNFSSEVLRGLTDEELLRSVDHSNPEVKELCDRLGIETHSHERSILKLGYALANIDALKKERKGVLLRLNQENERNARLHEQLVSLQASNPFITK